MTLEQLRVFVAVAERLHMTRAAETLHITQSGASAAIAALEAAYGIQLFDRIGRGLGLTEAGRVFLPEARAVLACAAAARQALDDLAGLKRGNVRLYASQTIASYWLPPRLVRLRRTWPQIAVELFVGNTARVARAVRDGEVELGLIEGAVTEPLLINTQIGSDRLVVVTSAARPWRTSRRSAVADLVAGDWVVREPGSGTRSEFEEALRAQGIEPDRLNVLTEMPSNEAVLAAVATGGLVAAVSELAAGPMLNAGLLRLIPFDLPPRRFDLLQHRERQPSHATAAVVDVLWHGSA
jgi:DNA-binding transcriptional LysR family regulator